MAQCLIPNTPQLLGEVEVSTANEIQFTIQSDLTAYLYQVYLLNGENLEKYITTSNTFFKTNAFRPGFTTVDGGYGTFGAITSNLFVVP